MEAIGVKNWRTYSKALSDLVEWGFIDMIEISKNQYSSNIIAIVKNTKAPTKALDKALQKHSTKQGESIVSIDKQLTIEQETINNEFERFWNMYNKKTSRKKCESKFKKLSTSDKDKIFSTLPNYIKLTPDPQYRKDPSTYLNNESWNDEGVAKIIDPLVEQARLLNKNYE